MATKTKKNESTIQFGSEEHVSAVQNAYKIRPQVAQKVVEQFEKGEGNWEVAYYDKCKRMMSVINNPIPKPVSPRKGWKRDRSY